MEVFDPQENRWSKARDVPIKAVDVQAAVLDEEIYVAGGKEYVPLKGWRYHYSVYRYTPKKNSWSEVGKIPYTGGDVDGIVGIQGRLYILSGAQLFSIEPKSGKLIELSCYRYTVGAQRTLWDYGVVSHEDTLFVVGGNEGSKSQDTLFAYHPPAKNKYPEKSYSIKSSKK